MGIIYHTAENEVTLDSGDSIHTYGIYAQNISDPENILAEFTDVSVDKNFAEKTACLLNKYEVELCHFFDVVIDELNR
jgi:hypothetical protein